MKLGPLIVALALMLGPLRLSSQRSGQLLTDARDQIRAQNLDSAITLLQVLTTPGQADSGLASQRSTRVKIP